MSRFRSLLIALAVGVMALAAVASLEYLNSAHASRAVPASSP